LALFSTFFLANFIKLAAKNEKKMTENLKKSPKTALLG